MIAGPTGAFLLLALGAAALATQPSLMSVELPAPDQVVGLGGVEVLIRFSTARRAEPATFRALLNGADVTEELETARNGVHGRLVGLLEGPNRLRLEVFGHGWWLPGRLVEEVQEIELLYRPPLDLDRA